MTAEGFLEGTAHQAFRRVWLSPETAMALFILRHIMA